ncbi:MAG TPA: Rne/Rng family ribonuclease [Armatimonadota bacterium]
MSKEIIVNVDPRETRVAIIESGRLVELHIEREERVVGCLYKCRVVNVLPGMDASFVEIGLDRNAFLYVGDILPDADDADSEGNSGRDRREYHIRDVVKPGQELLVQVVKAPRGTKGARVSTRISLPGRYLVFMPDTDSVGVSRKIEQATERDRLKKIASKVKDMPCGIIVRTEAEGKTEAELKQDYDFLCRLWAQVQETSRKVRAPGVVHQDLSLLYRIIRDVFSNDVSKLIIDSDADYEKALELVEFMSPKLKGRVFHYTEPDPIFQYYGVEAEIERLTRKNVWLKSGGYLSIDETEALTTIDVNTGKFIGSTSLADTILKTNLDAVNEVSRQLRLRDIGGVIIIDFIDMSSMRDRQHVMDALDRALKKDRVRTKIAHISPLGLVEMTRKRTGESLVQILTEACPYCQGRGRVTSPETMAARIERDLLQRCVGGEHEAFMLRLNPNVAIHILGPQGQYVERLERETRRALFVRADPELHIEDYVLEPGDLQQLERQVVRFRPGQVVECQVKPDNLVMLPRSAAWLDGYFVDLANGGDFHDQRVRARITHIHRSYALGEVVMPARVLDKAEPI